MPATVQALQRAKEWQSLLDSEEARTRTDIARRVGISRARVTQVMGLLRLPLGVQKRVLALPVTRGVPRVSVRALQEMSVSSTFR